MQNPQFELCCEVLRRLRKHRVLQHLVLTGSWCLLLYRQYFEKNELFSTLRTRDMDFLVPIPLNFSEEVNLPALFERKDVSVLKAILEEFPASWRKTIQGVLVQSEHEELRIQLKKLV